MILIGDIGGTTTRLGLFSRKRGPYSPVVRKSYSSRDFPALEHIIRDFLAENGASVKRACFGVAGPIKHGRTVVTNLPWIIDAGVIKEIAGIEHIQLLNDLEAMAHAVPHLEPSMLEIINPGTPSPGRVKALVAPGTGLGEVFLTWDGCRYRSCSSEGGHADFGPRTDLEIELLKYLRQSFDHVSYERVCSGIGIPHLYSFLRSTGEYAEPPGFAEILAAAPDQTPVIVEAGTRRPEEHPICVAVLELFTAILGAEVGNLALKVSSHGGMYIGGGISLRIPEYIRKPLFLESFKAKGRLSPLIADIPIYLATKTDMALFGAACYTFAM